MIVAIVTSAITGGLAGAVLNIWFVPRREKSNRKRAFRAFIQSVEYDLEIVMQNWKHLHPGNPYFLYDWQKEAAAKIAPRCAEVLEDIPAIHQKPFMDLLWHFSRQGRRDVEPYEGKQPDKPHLFSDHQQTLSDLLKRMTKYAS